MFGFCKVWACLCVGVCMCEFCNVWLCPRMGYVMCGCLYMCVF